MAKTSGLGDNFYIAQYDLSGDTASLSSIHGGNSPLPVTGINQFGMARIGGKRDGGISFTAFWNDAALTGSHAVLKTLPLTDVIGSYFRGAAVGNDAASMTSKQLNYDPTRGQDGSLTSAVELQANGYGLEWGTQLTAGLRTDTVATNGTSIDTTASASFGGQAYLHVTAFSGTDVTIKIQDSANNSAFADVAGFGFTSVTAATSERIALGSSATLRQYIRVVTATTGGFTSVTFAVNCIKNSTAVSF